MLCSNELIEESIDSSFNHLFNMILPIELKRMTNEKGQEVTGSLR